MTNTARFENPTLTRLDNAVLPALDDIPEEVQATARLLASVIGDVSVMWSTGRDPVGVAAACVYLADCAIRQNGRHTQTDLAKRLPTSHPTIRKNYTEIPQVFFENATEEDLAALDDDVRVILERFLAAEQSGEGINYVRYYDLPTVEYSTD